VGATYQAGQRLKSRPGPPLRVAVVTEDRLLSEGLLRIIDAAGTFLIVDDKASPDVVLLDCRNDGSLATCAARKPAGGARIILIGAPDNDSWASDALAAGARGILIRSAGHEEMIAAINSVHEGLIWARRRVISARIDHLSGLSGEKQTSESLLAQRLSIREREVFHAAATGLGNKELAGRLEISEATVKVHLTHIFQKLGVQGRAELAAAYYGLVQRSS